MFSFQRIKLFDVCGIPLYVDVSTLFMLLFFVGMTNSLILDLVLMVGLLASIVLHELGHALTARPFGCPTDNITLSVIGGCASLSRMPTKAWQEILVATAGPAVSFLLGAICLVLSSLLARPLPILAQLLIWIGIMNLTLGLFNLLPGFPMDGGRIFRAFAQFFTSRVNATYWAMIVGRIMAVALVLLPEMGIRHIFIIPIGGSLLMRIFIAVMIWVEGKREYLMTRSSAYWDDSVSVSPPPYGGTDAHTSVHRAPWWRRR